VAFLKRHGFVIAGVALPVLVALAFVLARLATRYYVAEPRYDVVYQVAGGYAEIPTALVCDVAPVDGRLRARWVRVEQAMYTTAPRVFRLDPAQGEPIELSVPRPDDLAAVGDSRDLFVAGLEDVRIDSGAIAPDGYAFETSWSGGGGLFGEIFGRGSRGPRTPVHKNGRRIEVPQARELPYGYGTLSFLGWCIPVEETR
jgi:hypothetical protein